MLGVAQAQTSAAVTVNAGSSISTLQPGSIGVNTPVFDPHMLDSAIPGLISKSGWALRFPAGTTADIYNWQTNAIVPNQSGGTYYNDTFDNWMGLVKSIGATPMLTVNYGTDPTGKTGGSTSFAAQWVQYSNITKGYGVKYWEIGNEIYGNGFYDNVDWEPDLHAAHDPTTYGNNVVAFAKAMKAVDPTIKIGAVLTAPGNWPDGVAPAWNPAVLTACGQYIDFVILHWYPQGPGGETDAGLLASTTNGTYSIPNMMATIKSLLTQYAGSNASNIQIVASEINSVYSDPGKQMTSVVNGMFIADAMMTWLEQGAVNVDIWDLHNGSYTQGNNSSSLYGTTTFGDYGIFSNASSEEPSLNTPFPSFYGMQMITLTGKPGDTLVSTTSSNSLLTTHAVQQAGGNLALMMINKDPSNATTANISVAGFTPATTATQYLYGSTSATIASSTLNKAGGTFSVTVPSYSIATVVLTPYTTPKPSFTLAASPSSVSLAQGASGSSTVTVAPAGGFTGSVSFSISGLPGGVTAAFSPASSTGSSVLTFTASSTAAAQTSVMTVTGTSGALSATAIVSLTVTAAPVPSFSLSANPASVSLVQGASGTSTITITPSGGFTGAVALAASGLPSGVSASLSAASTSSTSILTLAAAATATAATSNVTITGSSGSLSQTLSLPVAVTAATSGGGTSGGTGSGPGPASFAGSSSSNSAWYDEDDVTVKTPSAITAMTLTVTVPATNVSYSGSYSTVGSQITEAHSSGSNIVYTFTLTSGQTIGAGSYTFASQMDGNGTTHNYAGDSWTVTYTIGGQTYTQSGVI